MKKGEKWAEMIMGNQIPANDYIKMAVARYFDDHRLAFERKIFFDRKQANRVISYIRKFKHTKGDFAGKRFEPEPWQEFYLMNIYGWYRADNTRRFNLAYLDIGRKNGKTSLAAIQALYGLFGDNEIRAEVYAAATKEDQARICLNEGKAFIKTIPGYQEIFNIFTKAITVEEINGKYYDSTFKPLGRDSETQDGLNPSTAVIDEYHAHKTADLFNVIKSGMGSRKNPLIIIITTAGFNREAPCYHFRENAIKVLQGVNDQDNLFAMIFTLDEGDDWNDQANWIKANPNLNSAVNLKFLQDQYKSAVNLGGSDEVNFKTKHLNIWTDAAETWIQDAVWMAGNKPLPDLDGAECMGGLDLASVRDITALVLLFKKDGKYYILPFFWIPEAKLHEKQEIVDYIRWRDDGFIYVTPGNATDYDYIKEEIKRLKGKYNIKNIAYDRWNTSQLVIDLTEKENVKMEPFGQGFGSMSAPTKQIEKLAYEEKFIHAGNPVLRWMCSNVALQTNPAGDIKMDKSKSTNKIDGMVALAMALGLYLNEENKEFIYNNRGIRTI